ncbi:hypothetical protein BDZ89DRAFT_1045318 [Hymenopellis radicata]|nr:hypothetical protein BDZ89DRAFT_1045318 [Hymenopellis radicata]
MSFQVSHGNSFFVKINASHVPARVDADLASPREKRKVQHPVRAFVIMAAPARYAADIVLVRTTSARMCEVCARVFGRWKCGMRGYQMNAETSMGVDISKERVNDVEETANGQALQTRKLDDRQRNLWKIILNDNEFYARDLQIRELRQNVEELVNLVMARYRDTGPARDSSVKLCGRLEMWSFSSRDGLSSTRSSMTSRTFSRSRPSCNDFKFGPPRVARDVKGLVPDIDKLVFCICFFRWISRNHWILMSCHQGVVLILKMVGFNGVVQRRRQRLQTVRDRRPERIVHMSKRRDELKHPDTQFQEMSILHKRINECRGRALVSCCGSVRMLWWYSDRGVGGFGDTKSKRRASMMSTIARVNILAGTKPNKGSPGPKPKAHQDENRAVKSRISQAVELLLLHNSALERDRYRVHVNLKATRQGLPAPQPKAARESGLSPEREGRVSDQNEHIVIFSSSPTDMAEEYANRKRGHGQVGLTSESFVWESEE